uniref:HNH endonuclease n=1 Tax=Marseillevirus LCMAC101 TaxID=2506602 RepID=A0A481YSW5_9VIRU|nr:MAG: uncharacterized protein LCMAC101_04600 [Marseillevirus LCMAC101]
MEKKCTSCQEVKSLDGFHKLKSGKYGRNAYCKVCRSEKRKEKAKILIPVEKDAKYCSKCKETKEISCFFKEKSMSDGCQTYCKICSKVNYAKWCSTFDGFITRIYKDLQNNAEKRNIKVNIEKDDIIRLYKKQKGVCALSGEKMTHVCEPGTKRKNPKHIYNISVDRINSSKPYTLKNIQLVCNRINVIKWDLDQDVFIDLCKKVAALHA